MTAQAEGQEPDATKAEPGEKQEPKQYDEDYVHGLNRENAKWRTQVRDLEKQVETLTKFKSDSENSTKTEVERLTEEKSRLERELTDREQAHQALSIETAVKLKAQKDGLVDPDGAYRLIDTNLLEYEDGKVIGLDRAFKALLKDKPYLEGKEEEPEPPTPGVGGEHIDTTGKPSFEKEILKTLKGHIK